MANLLNAFGKITNLCRRTWRWLKDVGGWCAEAKLFVWALVMTALSLVIGIWVFGTERSIRISGLGLQLVGMYSAIKGLLGIRAYFQQPTLPQLFVSWLGRFPKWNRNQTIKFSGTASSTFSGHAELTVWSTDDPSKPFEERLAAIVRNLDRLNEEHRGTQKSVRKLTQDLNTHKTEVTNATKKLEENMRKDMESLHTNDLLKSLIGLVVLTIGIFMSTAAPELAAIFN